MASAGKHAKQVSEITSQMRTLPSLLRDASRPGLVEQLAKSTTAVVCPAMHTNINKERLPIPSLQPDQRVGIDSILFVIDGPYRNSSVQAGRQHGQMRQFKDDVAITPFKRKRTWASTTLITEMSPQLPATACTWHAIHDHCLSQ